MLRLADPSRLVRTGATAAASSGVATGSVNEKRVPLVSSLSTTMRPPCCSTRALVMARPRPVPPLRRDDELSTC